MMTIQLIWKEKEVDPPAPVQNQGGFHAPPIRAKAAAGAPQHLHGHHVRPTEVGRGRLCPAAIVLFRDRQVHQDQGPDQSQDQFQNPGQDQVRKAQFPALVKLKCARM